MRRRNLARHFEIADKAIRRSSSLTRALDEISKVKSPPKKEARIKGTKKTVVRGEKFDSKREAKYYLELLARKQIGEIAGFTRQVKYELIPAQYGYRERRLKYGKMKVTKYVIERAINYVADFRIDHLDGSTEIVDVKGYRTEVYRLKRKLMLYIKGIKIKEV